MALVNVVHMLIKFKLHIDAMRAKSMETSQNYRRARCDDDMRAFMRKDWHRMMEGKSVNEIWSIVKESLETAVAEYVPLRKKKRTDDPKWLDAEMRKKILGKRRAWDEWKRTGRATDRALYAKNERECKRMIRNKKNAYERNIAKNRNTNPKMYFSYVNIAKKNWSSEKRVYRQSEGAGRNHERILLIGSHKKRRSTSI